MRNSCSNIDPGSWRIIPVIHNALRHSGDGEKKKENCIFLVLGVYRYIKRETTTSRTPTYPCVIDVILSLQLGKLSLKRLSNKLDVTMLPTDAAAANSLQSCPTLCGPIDSSPPGSPVPGILQARTLEWVAISFSNV